MRVGMLETATRRHHAGRRQRNDHCLVGVALLALVGDDAAADEAGISIAAYLEALVLADAEHRIVRRPDSPYHQESMTA